MKITIDIPEDEVQERAKGFVAREIAKRIYGDYYNKVIREIVREVLNEDKANLENRAVAEAAKLIKKDAIKKLIAGIEGE